jgi:hypothetical protein
MINVVNPDFLQVWFQPSRHWFFKSWADTHPAAYRHKPPLVLSDPLAKAATLPFEDSAAMMAVPRTQDPKPATPR